MEKFNKLALISATVITIYIITLEYAKYFVGASKSNIVETIDTTYNKVELDSINKNIVIEKDKLDNAVKSYDSIRKQANAMSDSDAIKLFYKLVSE